MKITEPTAPDRSRIPSSAPIVDPPEWVEVPPTDERVPARSRRDRVLVAWARLVTARPWTTLIVCLALAAASLALTFTNLEFRSDRSELVDPTLPWQQRYAAMRRSFAAWDEPAVVVVDMGLTPESRAAGEQFIRALDARLSADPRFPRILSGFPRSQAPAGLIYSQSLETVEQAAASLSQTTPVLASATLDSLLSLSLLGAATMTPAQKDELAALIDRASNVAQGQATSVLGLDPSDTTQRLVTRSGRYAMVLVSLSHVSSRNRSSSAANGDAEAALDSAGGAVRALREQIRAVRQTPGLGAVHAGVTGIPVLESDETALSMRDATLAGVFSLAAITLLLLIAYRGFVVPLLAVLSLLIGMAWAFAWATLAVGHLQLLSVTFASLLLGLGIDVAIHIIARLELVHPDHDHLAGAIAQAFRGVGPGIITASVTVAAAAGAMALTDFAGVAEMGLIAAGGIILCTLSIMTALPALLMLMPTPEDRLLSHDGGEARPFMGGVGRRFHRRPLPLLALSGGALLVAAYLASGIRYDTDLLKLLPSTTESVRWQHALEDDDERSVWHAVVQARNLEEARDLTGRLRALPVVSDVDGAGMLFPDAAKAARISAVLATLPDPGAAPPASDAPASEAHVANLRRVAESIVDQFCTSDPALSQAGATLAAHSDAELAQTLRAYASDRQQLLQQVAALRSAQPATVDSLPAALREQIVGADGSLLLRIYPNDSGSAASVLAPERLKTFASAVLAAAPTATGPSIQIYESTRLINAAYIKAGVFALIAIVILLIIDFRPTPRGLGDTLCALFPVFAGALLMLAIMRLAGVDLNFANMIVMPLIVGIGVGSGVHVVRRWRLQPRDEPHGLAGGSGRAITLTTLTTVAGFASMMLAQHRGIRSLGFTMTVGLMMVWLVTIVALPAILRLRAGAASR